jgi:hypothetical protein
LDAGRHVRRGTEGERVVAAARRVDDDESSVDADARIARRISTPARIARAASSSCACG